jgi:hypothetical protein
MDDHAAVGGECSCAAVAFIVGRSMREFVLCTYQKPAYPKHIQLTYVKLDGVSKCFSHSSQTL